MVFVQIKICFSLWTNFCNEKSLQESCDDDPDISDDCASEFLDTDTDEVRIVSKVATKRTASTAGIDVSSNNQITF